MDKIHISSLVGNNFDYAILDIETDVMAKNNAFFLSARFIYSINRGQKNIWIYGLDHIES